MKLATTCILLVSILFAGASATVAQMQVFEIHFVTDTHHLIEGTGPRNSSLEPRLGGIARLAGWLDKKRKSGRPFLFVHSGDSFVGDPVFNRTYGAAELALLSALGCAAFCQGNHETDLGPLVLEQTLRAVKPGFPIVCANIDLSAPAVQGLRDFIKPHTVYKIGDVKIGLFGLTTPDANLISQPAPARIDPDVIGAAAREVKVLQAEGCQVIICLSHCGKLLDTAVARNVAGIHAILGGHDHAPLRRPLRIRNPLGDITLIAQPAPYYEEVGTLRIRVKNGKVRILNHRASKLNAGTPKNAAVDAQVKAFCAEAEKVWGPLYTQPVARVVKTFEEMVVDLEKKGAKDLPLPNLVADAIRAKGGTNVAFVPGGTVALPLYRGPVVAADIFRTVGYGFNTVDGLGFRLVNFKMTGAALVAGLELGLSGIEAGSDDFFGQVSGMRYTYDPKAEVGKRVVSATVNGSPLNPAATYTVTTDESIPMFLTAFSIPFSGLVVLEKTTEFQAVLDHVKGKTLVPRVEGRVLCVPSRK